MNEKYQEFLNKLNGLIIIILGTGDYDIITTIAKQNHIKGVSFLRNILFARMNQLTENPHTAEWIKLNNEYGFYNVPLLEVGMMQNPIGLKIAKDIVDLYMLGYMICDECHISYDKLRSGNTKYCKRCKDKLTDNITNDYHNAIAAINAHNVY